MNIDAKTEMYADLYKAYPHFLLPDFIKNLLNEFLKTKFMKMQLEKRLSRFDESHRVPDELLYLYADYDLHIPKPKMPAFSGAVVQFIMTEELAKKQVKEYFSVKPLNNKLTLGFLPFYRMDKIHVLQIDFDKLSWHTENGIALDNYGTGWLVRQSKQIYMKPMMDKFWREYQEWLSSGEKL